MTAALIVAAGRGRRAGGGAIPKQYLPVFGQTVLARTLDLFLEHPGIAWVAVVIGPDDGSLFAAVAPQHKRLLAPVAGGSERQESVRQGLETLGVLSPGRVLIHDGVRPFATAGLIDRVLAGLSSADAVVPTQPVRDTLKTVRDDRIVAATVPRDGLETAETPQGFRFDAILAAHRAAATSGVNFTDDASIAEWAGIRVLAVPGEPGNVKLTTLADIESAGRRLAADGLLAAGDVRVGTGYDVHAFGPGASVMLGGVAIPHSRGVVGHSDADVALHALTDAILGALADGDIGVHFPPSNPEWKGASSDRFVRFAVERVAARGGTIAHVNIALIAEAPRIAAYRDAMRERIAAICGIGMDRVGLTATTNERLGFIGRGEGIAAVATATIRLPFRAP